MNRRCHPPVLLCSGESYVEKFSGFFWASFHRVHIASTAMIMMAVTVIMAPTKIMHE